MMTTARLTAECKLAAAASGKLRRFTADPAYSGGELPGTTLTPPLRGNYVVDLATLEPRNERLIANLDHDAKRRVGHVDDVQNDGRTLTLAGVVSAATESAREFLESADDTFPWSVSIEAALSTPKLETNVTVNGRFFKSIYVVRNARLSGLAFVSAGADPSAHAIAASFHRGNVMISASEQTKILSRVEGVTLKCGTAFSNRLNEAKERALCGELDPLAFEHEVTSIEAGDAELHQLRASRTQPGSLTTHRAEQSPAAERVLQAAFCLAGGLPNIDSHFAEPVLDVAESMRREVGLQNLIMRAAVSNGYQSGPAETLSPGNVRPVLQAAFSPTMKASGYSTISVGGILGPVANKFLVDGWNETSGDEWQKISDIKSVKNFHAARFFRLLDNSEYEELGAGGEIQHGTLGEQSMSVQARTYGKMFGLNHEQIINDDTDAFFDMPRRLGRASGMKFRRVFWGAFLAADGFWDAANGNVVTGAGTALDLEGTSLQSALTAFRAMRTSEADGRKLIGGKPAVLMVPPDLEITARRLLTSTGVVAGGGSEVGMLPSGNPFANLAELVVADWLSDADLTGFDPAKWYLLRNPRLAPAMLVAFLNGQQYPTVETADADFNQLGILFRGHHSFGVARGEPLCGLRMEGTPAEDGGGGGD